MSHTAQIRNEFKVSEFSNLEKAFKHFGWNIVQNQVPRSYYNQEKRSFQHVAINPDTSSNAYDIGLELGSDGQVKLFTDYYGGSVERTLGRDLGNLKQEYAYRVTEDEYAWSGQVSRTVDENGVMNVEVALN